MFRNFSLVSNTGDARHFPEFRRLSLEIHEENLRDASTSQDKLDVIRAVERHGLLITKDASRRPASMASEVQLCLNTVWDEVISTAEVLDFDQDAALHDQLVSLLLSLKEFDTLCRALYPSANPFPSWESYQFGERLQSAGTSSKALAVGICGDSLSRTALSCLRNALEVDDEAKAVARLPMAVVWIDHCRHQLVAFSVMNRFGENTDDRGAGSFLAAQIGGHDVEVGGYSLERWLFWRKRFQTLSHHADAVVANEAKTGFMSMISCGLDLDCDVPGEAGFREKVAVAMSDELNASGRPSVDIDDINVDVGWVDQVEAA
ncbi:hypothetical protein B0T16DRAFT_462902 [Cercophora newfieldiana]|uniref:Uncharacterized protein n=1 Tax=Cercophora newfieldiana TaxID=92897 RepID=A0AA40CI14_9PEZI|nr:hypothetical protein B0T16DRAFT_462902 [Cercophora newfieldiana]